MTFSFGFCHISVKRGRRRLYCFTLSHYRQPAIHYHSFTNYKALFYRVYRTELRTKTPSPWFGNKNPKRQKTVILLFIRALTVCALLRWGRGGERMMMHKQHKPFSIQSVSFYLTVFVCNTLPSFHTYTLTSQLPVLPSSFQTFYPLQSLSLSFPLHLLLSLSYNIIRCGAV